MKNKVFGASQDAHPIPSFSIEVDDSSEPLKNDVVDAPQGAQVPHE